MSKILDNHIVTFDFREALCLRADWLRETLADEAFERIEQDLLCPITGRHPWAEVTVGDSGYVVNVHDLPETPRQDNTGDLPERVKIITQVLDRMTDEGRFNAQAEAYPWIAGRIALALTLWANNVIDGYGCPECQQMSGLELDYSDASWHCTKCGKQGFWYDEDGKLVLLGDTREPEKLACSRCGGSRLKEVIKDGCHFLGWDCPDCGTHISPPKPDPTPRVESEDEP